MCFNGGYRGGAVRNQLNLLHHPLSPLLYLPWPRIRRYHNPQFMDDKAEAQSWVQWEQKIVEITQDMWFGQVKTWAGNFSPRTHVPFTYVAKTYKYQKPEQWVAWSGCIKNLFNEGRKEQMNKSILHLYVPSFPPLLRNPRRIPEPKERETLPHTVMEGWEFPTKIHPAATFTQISTQRL